MKNGIKSQVLLSVCVVYVAIVVQVSSLRKCNSEERCQLLTSCPAHVRTLQGLRDGIVHVSGYNDLKAAICGGDRINRIPQLCCPTGTAGLLHPSSITLSSDANPPTSPPTIFQTFPQNTIVSHSETLTTHISPVIFSPTIQSARPSPRPAPSLPSTPYSGSPLLPSSCGKSANPDKIVNGEDAKLGAYPWIALLYGRESPRSEATFLCGGSLITQRFVVTAAHCITFDNAIQIVRLGEHTVSRNPDCEQSSRGACAPAPQDISPRRVIKHRDFDKPGCLLCNDIALIELSIPVTLTRYVSPVCLPVDPVRQMGFSARQFLGKVAVAAGWGSVNKDTATILQSDVLQQTKLRLMACSGFNNKKQLCVDVKDSDTCKGDSGGPLMLTDSSVQRSYLVGLTSFGNSQCATTPSVFTDVNLFVPWILQNIR